ncbi:unnamed protein product, partial [Closterium sp. NIES-54]
MESSRLRCLSQQPIGAGEAEKQEGEDIHSSAFHPLPVFPCSTAAKGAAIISSRLCRLSQQPTGAGGGDKQEAGENQLAGERKEVENDHVSHLYPFPFLPCNSAAKGAAISSSRLRRLSQQPTGTGAGDKQEGEAFEGERPDQQQQEQEAGRGTEVRLKPGPLQTIFGLPPDE